MDDYSEALKDLLEVIKDKCKERIKAWMDWRVKHLWCLEVDDLYKANREDLGKIFKIYQGKEKSAFITRRDAF
jgi:hypothetical protein